MTALSYIRERVIPNGDCWEWALGCSPNGYGKAKFEGRDWRAHRLAYFAVTGEQPEVVHHVCENKKCCNPEHLAPTTFSEHSRDVHKSWRYNAEASPQKPTCRAGHSRAEHGYTRPGGTWGCRACVRIYTMTYRKRKRRLVNV